MTGQSDVQVTRNMLDFSFIDNIRMHGPMSSVSPVYIFSYSTSTDYVLYKGILDKNGYYNLLPLHLGRQRDSAAAASRGPCSQEEQRDPLFVKVERHQQTVAN